MHLEQRHKFHKNRYLWFCLYLVRKYSFVLLYNSPSVISSHLPAHNGYLTPPEEKYYAIKKLQCKKTMLKIVDVNLQARDRQIKAFLADRTEDLIRVLGAHPPIPWVSHILMMLFTVIQKIQMINWCFRNILIIK